VARNDNIERFPILLGGILGTHQHLNALTISLTHVEELATPLAWIIPSRLLKIRHRLIIMGKYYLRFKKIDGRSDNRIEEQA
jgi:hypothetical protein